MSKTKRTETEWMFAYGSLLEMSLTSQDSQSSSVQRSAGGFYWDQTSLHYSPAAKFSTNKGNGTLPHPSLSERLHCREKKNSSYLTNTRLFEVQTGKNEGLFSPLALHMTAIWEYCVFWPERVVYDRWWEKITSRWPEHRHANCFQLIAAFCLIFIKWITARVIIYRQEAADQVHHGRRKTRADTFLLPGESANLSSDQLHIPWINSVLEQQKWCKQLNIIQIYNHKWAF